MVFCASAAATHHSMQSEKRSSRLMRCVAFLKYMEQMKHWPRRGGLCETGVFLLIDNICTTQSLSCAQLWAITMLIVWELSWTVRVYGEVREEALQCFGKELPHPVFCTWSITRKDTRSESRGIQLVISEVWEQQTVEWVSTDGLRSLVIWYASLSGYKALRLSSYSTVQQK